MANVIIEHADGRRYSTTQAGFEKLYQPQGFKVIGDESDASFALNGLPTPEAARPSRRKAAAKAKTKAKNRPSAKATPKAPATEPAPPEEEAG